MGLVRSLVRAVALAVVLPVLLGALAVPPGGLRAETLRDVRERGLLRCGVSSSGVGLSAVDDSGRWRGVFVDMCRALAAAAAGHADRVEFVETNSENRFAILRNGEVDVVMEGATWTLQRDATFGVDFPTVYLFDGQGFIAHRVQGFARLSDLPAGSSVCVLEQTTSLRNLEDWMARTGVRFRLKRVRSTEGALSAFFNHHCDLYTSDSIGLHAQRVLKAPDPDDYVILSEVISKEPLGPMVRSDERNWFELVRWVFLSTVLAEEKGITAANAQRMKEESPDPEVRRLLGASAGVGWGLGLDDDWAFRVVTQVGNYGEIFDRHLGAASPLGIGRGLNGLWKNGGLHYAPPLGG